MTLGQASSAENQERTGVELRAAPGQCAFIAQVIGLVATCAASVTSVVLPAGFSYVSLPQGRTIVTLESIAEVAEPSIFVPALCAILIAALPVIFRRRGWRVASIVTVVLMAAFIVVNGTRIGPWILPDLAWVRGVGTGAFFIVPWIIEIIALFLYRGPGRATRRRTVITVAIGVVLTAAIVFYLLTSAMSVTAID